MCFGGLHLFLKIVNKQLKIVNKQLKNENKWRPPKHILAVPTWGQKCVFSQLQPFELANFDLGHPVSKSLIIDFYMFTYSNDDLVFLQRRNSQPISPTQLTRGLNDLKGHLPTNKWTKTQHHQTTSPRGDTFMVKLSNAKKAIKTLVSMWLL